MCRFVYNSFTVLAAVFVTPYKTLSWPLHFLGSSIVRGRAADDNRGEGVDV